MQSKIPHFYVYQVDKRNLSVYLSLFLKKLLSRRKFSVYLSARVLNLIPTDKCGPSYFCSQNVIKSTFPG